MIYMVFIDSLTRISIDFLLKEVSYILKDGIFSSQEK